MQVERFGPSEVWVIMTQLSQNQMRDKCSSIVLLGADSCFFVLLVFRELTSFAKIQICFIKTKQILKILKLSPQLEQIRLQTAFACFCSLANQKELVSTFAEDTAVLIATACKAVIILKQHRQSKYIMGIIRTLHSYSCICESCNNIIAAKYLSNHTEIHQTNLSTFLQVSISSKAHPEIFPVRNDQQTTLYPTINKRIRFSFQNQIFLSDQMVKFTVEEVRRIMDHPQNIRNISVIAHVDHGKSTLSDSLVAKAGIISQKIAGKARILDQRQDEIERGITIKSTGVSMYYRHTLFGKEQEYLINLIDSPGHVDFSSEVTAALRVTDGALVVVDAVEGVCVQTETVLRQAIQEKIRPVLMINKVDRAIHELQLTPEEIYQRFLKVIEDVNVVVASYQHDNEEDLTLDPVRGNVVFGAGKDQWAFSLSTFAQRYNKYDDAAKTFISRIWGDNYYDDDIKKWSKESCNEKGEKLQRGFVKFVMEPVCRLTRAIAKQEKEEYEGLIEKLKIALSQDERKLVGKELGRVVMSRWIPAADCLLETVICHLPSPVAAQHYRAPYLYEGPQDETLAAMAQCDPKGPLCVYISKMIPIDGGRFAAFGRIFSGTIRSGERVRILGSNYKSGSKIELFEKNIGQVGVFMMGKNPELIGDIPCGNTVAITGIDDYLLKTGTITAITVGESYPIRSMKYSVAAVFRVAVKAKHPADLPKLQKGLTKLSKSDPLLKVDLEQTGEIVLAGSGELHIEICVNDLRAFAQCEIIVSPPIVTYKETITQEVTEPLLVKSANKHNRIFGSCLPLQKELVSKIQSSQIDPSGDPKQRAERLCKEHEWDKTDAMKIWCFGPENQGANILVDMVKGAQYVNEIRDSVCTAFQHASKGGVLAEENMRGCRFNIVDAKIHADAVHRNGAQIMPASRRLFQGLELAAEPTLLEPIFMCEITAPNQALGGVYYTLSQKRGEIIQEIKLQGSPLHIVKAYLPVAESFGFASILRANTQGMAFPQNFFDHWEMISGLPYHDNKAEELVLGIRRRKGMKEELPVLEHYVDKL